MASDPRDRITARYPQVLDLPWPNAPPVQRDCLCSNRSLPINIKSTSNIVEVHFTVRSMDALDDYNNLFFEGIWEFVKTIPCLQKRRVRGPSGEIKYKAPIVDEDEVRLFDIWWMKKLVDLESWEIWEILDWSCFSEKLWEASMADRSWAESIPVCKNARDDNVEYQQVRDKESDRGTYRWHDSRVGVPETTCGV